MHVVGRDPLLSSRVLDKLTDLVRGYWSDADQRLLEVSTSLPGLLPVAALHDAAQAAGDVALAGHGALVVVLLVTRGGRAADMHLTWHHLLAHQSRIALVLPIADLPELPPGKRGQAATSILSIQAHESIAAVSINHAGGAVALGRLLNDVIQPVSGALQGFGVHFFGLLSVRVMPIRAASVAEVRQHIRAEAVEQPAPRMCPGQAGGQD